ncbi:hypothetical protein LTR20_001168 [Exophiala xenobiotica]|nr:hypothetical protein LTS13_005445 [Exophiala xenobiotica]KAK5397028.1 hypothetical protein LTR79_005664 [Exophiala xenobiotica]KAK5410564.1 hypothetical protein LTR90_008147 [Exophiala xenobiotica]KAK5470907.1 hypothetical protein LTR20_001168 [Exophiala xenobiotica]KAK5478413.1 hypothetical protein LTR26_007923 [Exophiala xenobiotica]
MSTTKSSVKPNYPGPRDLSETKRLKAQSDLVTAAFGGLVLCPVDLTASDLRVLDSGTADGLFLRQLRSMLAYPDSATLIGTDIAPLEQNVDKPDYIEWHKQDINADWPEVWQGTFDFVHQRVVSNTASFGSFGLNNHAGDKLDNSLSATGEVTEIGHKEAAILLGVSAEDEETRQAGRVWLSGLRHAVGNGLVKMSDSATMSQTAWNDLVTEVEDQSVATGVEFKWWAAWGKRKISA